MYHGVMFNVAFLSILDLTLDFKESGFHPTQEFSESYLLFPVLLKSQKSAPKAYLFLIAFIQYDLICYLMLLELIDSAVPDFRGDAGCVEKVAKSGLDVFAHNIETVEELQGAVRDHRANFKQSLDVLVMAKEFAPSGTLTKTSIMLGCGETPDQVVQTMEKVRAAGVDVMTFGQYMRPSKRHMPVSEYITPEAFEKYQNLGMKMVHSLSYYLNIFIGCIVFLCSARDYKST